VSFIITGFKEIDDKLKGLEKKVQKKVTRQAMRKGLKPVLSEARANAPVDTGELRKGIKIKSGKGSRRQITMNVQTTDPNYVGKFLEFGTRKMKAHPFMRPAYDTKGDQATAIALDELRKGVEREAE
jgi:HK97 gp10 family phage protein